MSGGIEGDGGESDSGSRAAIGARGGGLTLAITGALLDGEIVGVRCEGERIAAIGPDVAPREGDETIDAGGMALLPPLINGHTHAAMTLFRGYGEDLPLMEWLQQRIWPIEARLEPDDVYWGARLACLEMIRAGTSRFWDMYWHPEATARAVADSGLRAVIGAPLIDGGDPDNGAKLRDDARASLEALAGAGQLAAPALAPHAIYTVSEPSLRWIAEHAAEHELPIHIHVSETESEVADCIAAHGERPLAYLDRVGLVGPRTLLAHAVWLDAAELDLVAERGATLVTNPVANLKLGVGGVFPYLQARERGVPVGLGTDGAGSNNSLDLLQDVKLLALLQKNEAGDAAAITAAEALEIATGHRAPLLGGGAELAPGEPADLVLVRTDAPELAPGDLVANLVYAAAHRAIDTTIVAGRPLMRGGRIDGAAEIRDQVVERARRLGIA